MTKTEKALRKARKSIYYRERYVELRPCRYSGAYEAGYKSGLRKASAILTRHIRRLREKPEKMKWHKIVG